MALLLLIIRSNGVVNPRCINWLFWLVFCGPIRMKEFGWMIEAPRGTSFVHKLENFFDKKAYISLTEHDAMGITCWLQFY
jgi:hypothetical protein